MCSLSAALLFTFFAGFFNLNVTSPSKAAKLFLNRTQKFSDMLEAFIERTQLEFLSEHAIRAWTVKHSVFLLNRFHFHHRFEIHPLLCLERTATTTQVSRSGAKSAKSKLRTKKRRFVRSVA